MVSGGRWRRGSRRFGWTLRRPDAPTTSRVQTPPDRTPRTCTQPMACRRSCALESSPMRRCWPCGASTNPWLPQSSASRPSSRAPQERISELRHFRVGAQPPRRISLDVCDICACLGSGRGVLRSILVDAFSLAWCNHSTSSVPSHFQPAMRRGNYLVALCGRRVGTCIAEERRDVGGRIADTRRMGLLSPLR